MKSLATCIFTCILIHAGCRATPVLEVHEGDKELRGVPFFVKVAEFTRSTSYEVRWIEATLQVKRGKDLTQSIARVLPESERANLQAIAGDIATSKAKVEAMTVALARAWRDPNEFDRLHSMLGDEDPQLEHFERSVDSMRKTPDDRRSQQDAVRDVIDLSQRIVDGPADALIERFQELAGKVDLDVESDLEQGQVGNIARRLVANTVASTPRIDYSTKHFINARVRPFTTTTQTAKLNGDLLLTEATTTVDTSKQLDAITSLLPIKELLTAVLVPVAPAEAQALDVQPGERLEPAPVTITLSIETRGYVYTFTQTAGSESELDRLLKFKPREIAFQRRALGSGGDKEDKEGKTIEFSGAVQLPKEEEGKASSD